MRSTTTDTRSRMLEYAVDLLESQGEQAIRVRDVAAAADVTYTAVDHHFGGREGLIEAAYLESYRRDLRAQLPEAIAAFDAATSAAEFASIVEAIMRRNFDPGRAPSRRRRAIALGAAATRPHLAAAIRSIDEDYYVEFARMLENPKAMGWVDPDVDVRAFAAVYIGIVNSRYLIEMAPNSPDGDAWNRIALRTLFALTEVDPPPASRARPA